MSDEMTPNLQKPLKEGTFIFGGIKEGDRSIEFTPPLNIKYGIYDKQNCEDDDLPEDTNIVGYVTYDFGLTMATNLDGNNHLINGYCGLTKESEPVEVLMYSIIYDLFHAFCHDINDPNYTHYHFALAGWLKDRVVVKDNE